MQIVSMEGASETSQRWPRATIINVRCGARRGTLLPGASERDALALVEQVLCRVDVDHATRLHLTRILTVTVQDWVRK